MRFHHGCRSHHELHAMRAALREAAGRRHGRGDAFGDGEFGFGGHHGGRFGGRVFGHGDLKLVLLALIAEEPRHGYELIRTIEEMFDGTYAPSPGAVYPTLTMLDEMGYASVDESGEGARKRYAITPEGKAFLDENRDSVEAVMARMQATARAMSHMRAPTDVRRAMHELKHALMSRRERWSSGEARRILAILKQAAKDIRGDD